MCYYLIIRGFAGVGKSTIAKALAKKLKAEYISFDEVMRKNKLDTVEGDSIWEKNFLKANKLVIPTALRELRTSRVVIFDGNFYHKSQIKHLASELKYPYKIFSLKAPLEECIARDRKRKKGRLGEKSVRAVYKLVSRLDIGTIINISNKSKNNIVQEIISYLN